MRELEPRVRRLCEELSAHGLPETLAHEEVHDSNVLLNAGRTIFIDWSDSCIGHPFFSLLVTIRAAAHRLKLEETGAEMQRLRDAYLEPWTKYETRGQLLKACALAFRLGMINRALSWHQGTGSLPSKWKDEYVEYVPGWLQDFLVAENEAAAQR